MYRITASVGDYPPFRFFVSFYLYMLLRKSPATLPFPYIFVIHIIDSI